MQPYSTGKVCFCFYVYILRKHEQCVSVLCVMCVCLCSRIGQIQSSRVRIPNEFLCPTRQKSLYQGSPGERRPPVGWKTRPESGPGGLDWPNLAVEVTG